MDHHSNKNQNDGVGMQDDTRYRVAAAENPRTLESDNTASLLFSTNTEPCLVSEVLSIGPSRIHNCVLAKLTLGHALKLFRVPYLLRELDKELQAVRTQGRSIVDLKTFFNLKVNVFFEALLGKFHRCRWKDLTKAMEWQKGVTLVNGTLIALYNRFVHSTEGTKADFRFSTCAVLEIGILNDDELLSRIKSQKVLFELCSLSSVKHENVIPHIKKFVRLSHHAIRAFVSGEKRPFAESKKLALDSFQALLMGYEKLVRDLRQLYRNCEKDPHLSSIKDSVWRALVDSGKRMRWMTRLKDQPFVADSLFLHECYGRSLEAAILEYTYLLSTCGKVAQKSSPRRKPKTFEPYYESDDHGYVNFVDPALFGASPKASQSATQSRQGASAVPSGSVEFQQAPANTLPSSRLLHRSQTFDESSSSTQNPAALASRRLSHSALTTENEMGGLPLDAQTRYDAIISSESSHRRRLQSLASYICHGTSLTKAKATAVLSEDVSATKVSLDEETAYWMFTDTLDAYSQYLQKELLCSSAFEDFDYEMDKSLDSLAVSPRREYLDDVPQRSEEEKNMKVEVDDHPRTSEKNTEVS